MRAVDAVYVYLDWFADRNFCRMATRELKQLKGPYVRLPVPAVLRSTKLFLAIVSAVLRILCGQSAFTHHKTEFRIICKPHREIGIPYIVV